VTAPTDFAGLVERLLDASVELILVGGLAANVHGSARATYDIDIVYRRSPENLDRLVQALGPLQPYLRGAPAGLPFVFDVGMLTRSLNFTLTTTMGDIDLLGEIVGGGDYDALLPESISIELFGRTCHCVSLGPHAGTACAPAFERDPVGRPHRFALDGGAR
jgi:hypothetical protein